jgi:hypothetical protein
VFLSMLFELRALPFQLCELTLQDRLSHRVDRSYGLARLTPEDRRIHLPVGHPIKGGGRAAVLCGECPRQQPCGSSGDAHSDVVPSRKRAETPTTDSEHLVLGGLWTTGSELCNAPRPLTEGLRQMSIKDLVVSFGVLIACVAVAWVAVVTAI